VQPARHAVAYQASAFQGPIPRAVPRALDRGLVGGKAAKTVIEAKKGGSLKLEVMLKRGREERCGRRSQRQGSLSVRVIRGRIKRPLVRVRVSDPGLLGELCDFLSRRGYVCVEASEAEARRSSLLLERRPSSRR